MMRAGALDHQITIKRKSVTNDTDYGTEIVDWVALATERFWAEVQDVLPSRSEQVKQGLAIGRSLTRIRMRYRNDIDSTMRITVHGDTDVTYQIIAGPSVVTSAGRKTMIEMMCEIYTSQGSGL
jgi:SPP1 family predicted phage head-tail adaptor